MNLAIFSSKEGSTFEAIVRAWKQNLIGAQNIILITDNPQAPVVNRAIDLDVPYFAISPKEFADVSSWSNAILASLKDLQINFILLAGFLKKVPVEIIQNYRERIVNTHPSLLPKFSGQGMYGKYVHQAVIEAGEKETGISLHFVTENYDEGPILAQRKITVFDSDTVESLEQRVKQEEKTFLIEELNKLLG